MSVVSRGFRRPQPPAWEGAVSQPRRVPAWTRRLMTAGIGARGGAASSAGPDAVRVVVVAGVFVTAGIVAGAGPDADRGVPVPARALAAAPVLVLVLG